MSIRHQSIPEWKVLSVILELTTFQLARLMG